MMENVISCRCRLPRLDLHAPKCTQCTELTMMRQRLTTTVLEIAPQCAKCRTFDDATEIDHNSHPMRSAPVNQLRTGGMHS